MRSYSCLDITPGGNANSLAITATPALEKDMEGLLMAIEGPGNSSPVTLPRATLELEKDTDGLLMAIEGPVNSSPVLDEEQHLDTCTN